MKIAFKISTATPADEAQVGETNFKAHYPEVNHSMLFDELRPYIEQATDLYVLPYISQAMYDSVIDIYHSGSPTLNAKQSRFLELLQRAVAYYTMMHALPKKLGVLASMGNVTPNPSGGAIPISNVSFKNQLWSVTVDADRFLDELLMFLQEEVNVANADFNAWKNSAAYTVGKSDYFRSPLEFQEYHNILRSHRTFIALLPHIKKSLDRYILPILGEDQHSALVTAIKANTASSAQLKLIGMIRKSLAEWSIYTAVPALTVLIEGDGIKVVSRTDGMDTRNSVAAQFYKEAAMAHQMASEELGRTFRADMIDFLYQNKDDYPLWVAGEYYTSNSLDDSCKVIGGHGGGVWM